MPRAGNLLTLNAGSSSLKFALFECGGPPRRVLRGTFDRLGLAEGALRVRRGDAGAEENKPFAAANVADCLPALRAALEAGGHLGALAAIAQRIVHGGPRFRDHQWADRALLDGLREIVPLAPNHAPGEIAFLEAVAAAFPGVPQAACFDTVFHRDLPRAAALLPLPRRLEAKGVRRYGFHGLSYASLMRQLPAHLDAAGARGRLVLAHLGNGASMAAVREGKCLDTTMGLTPLGGLVMSTRAGDLDPGVVGYLSMFEKLSAADAQRVLAAESGLKGLSETNGDVRDLLAREAAGDARAGEALAVFCHSARKHVGALAAALGGLDALVFAGGIGENSADLRARICAPLGFLGVELDPAANAAHGPRISRAGARAPAFVLKTDEEREMAEIAAQLLQEAPPKTL